MGGGASNVVEWKWLFVMHMAGTARTVDVNGGGHTQIFQRVFVCVSFGTSMSTLLFLHTSSSCLTPPLRLDLPPKPFPAVEASNSMWCCCCCCCCCCCTWLLRRYWSSQPSFATRVFISNVLQKKDLHKPIFFVASSSHLVSFIPPLFLLPLLPLLLLLPPP